MSDSPVEVSLVRLYLLRALYLLLVIGLGSEQWPLFLERATEVPLMHGVAFTLFCALSALSILGVRYPLQMLPLLLFEVLWKVIWLIGVALRLWLQGELEPGFMGTVYACAFGVIIFVPIIPWRYVVANYVTRRGDRWR